MLSHSFATQSVPGCMLHPVPSPRHEPLDLQTYLANAPSRGVAEREHVFAEGDRRSHIYRVESGVVCLYKLMPDGRRQVLGFAYPGDLIGLGTCDEYSFNAQATQATQLKCLRWSSLQSLARMDAELGFKLYSAISLELTAAHDLLLSMGRRSAVERIAAFLLSMSRRNEDNGRDPMVIDLPMTRSDIGDFLGLTIETVSRAFTKLRQQGLIDLTQCTRVRIVHIDELEKLAEGVL